jgi:hydrogenase maturation protease
MTDRPHILLLALGNDLLGDDAVGLMAAREVARSLPEGVDITEAAAGGFALLDLLEGYRGAVIVDAVATGRFPPGTVREIQPEEFHDAGPASPHYTGLPQLLELARKLGMTVPEALRIVAMEVHDPYELREGLTEEALAALPGLVQRTKTVLEELSATRGSAS